MSESISWWMLAGLLNFLWQGTVIGLVLAVALRALKRSSAERRYAVCSISLLAMAACFPITLTLLARDGWLVTARDPNAGPTAVSVESTVDAPGEAEHMGPTAGTPIQDALTDPTRAAETTAEDQARPEVRLDAASGAVITAANPRNVDEAKDAIAAGVSDSFAWVNTLVVLYVIGVACMLSRVVLLAAGSKRLRRSSELIDDQQVLAMFDELCAKVKLSVQPQLAYCHDVVAPAVIGVLRPVILVPPAMLTGLSPTQCETLLLHELAHIRRHDILFLSLQRVVESVLFFHPAVWYASRAMSVERENCCDDWVLRCGVERVRYADALVRMAEFALEQHRATPTAITVGALGKQNQLSQRILRLLTPVSKRPHIRHSKATVCGFFALTLTLTLSAVGWIDGTVAQELTGTGTEVGREQDSADEVAQDATQVSQVDRQALLRRYRESQFQPGVRVALKPIFGSVVGLQGKPISGAKVLLCERASGIQGWGRNTPTEARQVAETKTDAEGNYAFRNTQSQPLSLLRKKALPLDVIVIADGHAVRWRRIDGYGQVDFQLRESSRVTGRVVDERGKPLSGTAVRVLRILPLTEVANMDLAARFYPRFVGNCVDFAAADYPLSTKVDANGHFELDQLPRSSGVVLQVSNSDFFDEVIYTTANPNHPVWQQSSTPSKPRNTGYVVPSPMARQKRTDRETEQPPRAEVGLRESVQVSPIEIAMQPAIRLQLNIVDDETGKPVAAARLPIGPVFQYPADGEASAAGIYEYTGLTPGELYFRVEPPKGTDLLGQWKTLPLDAGVRNAKAEIRLKRGAIVGGRVVDDLTGQGVAGVRVNQTTTDKEGRFQLVTEPGKTKLVLTGRVEGYQIATKASNSPDANVQMVDASVDQPVRDVEFRLREQDLLFHGRTLDPQGNPIGGVRITGKKNVRYVGGGESYTPIDQASDELGRYILPGLFADGSVKRVVDVPIIFRDTSKSLAVRVDFAKRAGPEKTIERDIQLLPAGIVTGRVLHSETRQPLEGVRVSVTLWDGTSGAFDGSITTDADGRFEYSSLVPGGDYTVSFRKESFVVAGGGRSYSPHFTSESGETHVVRDFEMTPKAIAESMVKIDPLNAPSINGMEGKQALEKLLDQYTKDSDAYRKRLDAAKNASERTQIVASLEPNPVYATVMMQLADRYPDTDIEFEALAWVCNASVIAGSDSQTYRKQKVEAAKRLLEKYSDREAIADYLTTLVYRSDSPHTTAKKLASESPHRVVRGRASLLVAQVYERDLDMALRRSREPSPRDRELAIKFYQQVIDQYADLSDWRYGTIGKRAESALRELQKLWIGQPAPEIVGEDLEGNPLKLSDYRGKIVILAFTSQIDWWSLLARDMRAAGYEADKVVVLGVYSGEERDAAVASAKSNEISWKTWFDGSDDNPDSITRQWNNTSWPSYYMIDQDGIIRRRNMDRSGIPEAIEELW